MAEEWNEYDQGEAVKKWLRDNGFAIVAGVGLGLLVLYGWRFWWPQYQQQQIEAAARNYQGVVERLAGGEEATAATLEAYRAEHGDSSYTALVALRLAHQAIQGRNFDEAATLLRYAAEHAEPEALQGVAGLRLARVQLQAGQLEQALAQAKRYDQGPFEGLAKEIQGDVLLAQGDRDGARQVYQAAIDLGYGGAGSVLQLKLDDLNVVTAQQMDTGESALGATEEQAGTPPATIDAVEPDNGLPDGANDSDTSDGS